MKIYQRILVLLLTLTLGTAAACSTDEPTPSKNNDSEQHADTGSSDKDVESTDGKDVENTDGKDVENTDGKDTENTDGKDAENIDDTEVDDNDAIDKEDDTDVSPDPEENKTPLKDLSEEQVLTLCADEDAKINDYFDTANPTGVANCLLYAAYAAYDAEKQPSEMITACEQSMTSCTADYVNTASGKCINATGCKATVADFERCTDEFLTAEATRASTLIGKTCTDYTTEQSFQSLDDAFVNYVYPHACTDLFNKCPNIYN